MTHPPTIKHRRVLIGEFTVFRTAAIIDSQRIWFTFPSFADIGDIAGVAEVTIRQSYRSLIGRAAELFPPDFVFHTPIEKLPTS